MYLDDDHAFLTSVCLGNRETKPNRYFTEFGIVKTKENEWFLSLKFCMRDGVRDEWDHKRWKFASVQQWGWGGKKALCDFQLVCCKIETYPWYGRLLLYHIKVHDIRLREQCLWMKDKLVNMYIETRVWYSSLSCEGECLSSQKIAKWWYLPPLASNGGSSPGGGCKLG